MKTKICVCAMVAFILMGSIASKAEDFFSDETLNNIVKRLEQISGEHIALIKSGGNPDDVIAKADELYALAQETRRVCDEREVVASIDLPWGPNKIARIDYRQCLIAFERVAKISAVARNTTAKYCAMRGLKDKAKKII